MKEKIVLVDGHSILNRAFYGVPELTNSEGLHTNAVYGFLNILFKILDEEQPQYITVAFDVKAPTFRHELYQEYKGTRKPMPEELHEQVPLIKEILKAMGITVVEQPGFEADDILGTIATMAEEKGMDVALISGDRDLLQLASEHICVRIPKTKQGQTIIENYHAGDVKETYGVTPAEFIDMKALMGDSSDNIPGVPGIGEKTAGAIISAWHSIEEAYAHVEEIKPPRAKKALEEHYELARLSKVLATIHTKAPITYRLEDARIGTLFTQEAYECMKRFEFKSMLSRFQMADAAENRKETDYFSELTDFSEVEAYFDLAMQKEHLGFQLILEKGELLGLSLTDDKEHAVFIPCEGFVTEGYLLDKAAKLVKAVPSLATIGLKTQLQFLPGTDAESGFLDMEIGAYLLNPLKDSYDYDDIARDYLGMTVPSRSDLFGKQSLHEAREEKPEEFLHICCYASYISFLAKDVILEQLRNTEMESLYLTVEMPLVYGLYHMEQEGIAVDKDALKAYGERLAVRIAELEEEIHKLTGTGSEFNINSPKQLGEVLFEKMKLPFGKKTKSGYSTAADILEKLKTEHPVIGLILEYRTVTKLKSTYADGLAVFIREDGRIHGTFNQTITATGRISSTEPNLQNIPVRMELGREIRKLFVPKAGCVFVDADYSQIELRVLAHMSGDERLIEAYKEAQDIHAITASQVFHTPLPEVTPLQRRNAKAVNFGIVYGISAFGLSEDLSISRKEATEYIEQYFKTYPGVKKFLDRLVTEAKEKGYVTTMFGRRRPLPELKSSNFMQRQFGERVAMNAPIQGTAADIIKIAMIRVENRLKKEGLRSKLILQIHDELLIEACQDEIERVMNILQEEMQDAAVLHVPLEVEAHAGDSWFSAK